MKRPSRKDIRAAIDQLKEKAPGEAQTAEQNSGKLTNKKSSQRIRKQGV